MYFSAPSQAPCAKPPFKAHQDLSRGGAEIDLVLQNKKKVLGIQISITSDITPYSLRSMKSFLGSHSAAEGVVLAPVTESFTTGGIRVVPWTAIG